MTVGRANAGRAVFCAVILGLVFFGVLVVYAPDSAPLSPNNYGWNGLERAYSTYGLSFTTSLSSVPAGAVLVVMQPSVNFSPADVAAVRLHLAAGGTVVVAGKSGFATSLLERLGSGISIESGYSISDPIYNWKAKTLPTALVETGAASRFPFAANVSGIALNQPSPLVLRDSSAEVVAATSAFSYDVSSPGSSQVSKGPFAVVAAEVVGKGTLLVVSDSLFFLNSELTIASNAALIGNLFAGSAVFVDASHWTSSPLTSSTAQLKAQFREAYSQLSGSPARYIVTISFVLVALALVPSRERGVGQPPRPPDR
jgi:Domain of unknown function (DUF4350)